MLPSGNIKKMSLQLGIASFKGKEQRVRTLLDGGALIDYQDDSKRTALYRAAECGRLNIV
jgi:ankyrin repeat protein